LPEAANSIFSVAVEATRFIKFSATFALVSKWAENAHSKKLVQQLNLNPGAAISAQRVKIDEKIFEEITKTILCNRSPLFQIALF